MIDKRAIIVIFIAIILLLLFLFLQPAPANINPDWTEISSEIGSAKLYEEKGTLNPITFDDCCSGQIKVEFRHSWSFYHDDWQPADGCCHNPVEWSVKDSLGQVVFSRSESCPVSRTETITSGVWDCIHPWFVEVENGCLYDINYNYELTMYCLESTSSSSTFDFWDWITFWD